MAAASGDRTPPTMLITCPSCANQYTIDAGRVGAGGRTVRCAGCRCTWFVARETAPTPASVSDDDLVAHPIRGAEPPANLSVVAVSATPAAISADAQTARSPSDPRPPERRTNSFRGRKARKLGRGEAERPSTVASRAAGTLAVAAALAVALTAVLARAAVVGLWPETAILYAAAGAPVNLRGLALNGVRSELQSLEQETILVVEGEIANPTGREVEIPRLALAIRGTSGEALYTWTNEPPRGTLGPGETARFRARLASPPAEGRQVLVRFAAASDGTPVAAMGQ